MKVFSKSIWQTFIFSGYFLTFAVMTVYMRIKNGHPFACWQIGAIAFFILLFLFCAISLNYIILYEDRIVLKNKIYFFWSRTYMFKDIERLMVRDDISQARVYFRFVSKGKKSCKYVLDCVKEKDLQTIIEHMIKNKVNVEISESIIKCHFKKKI